MSPLLLAVLVFLASVSSLNAKLNLVGTSNTTEARFSFAVQGWNIKAGANVLVLGSGGLIGTALTAELKRRGFNVLEAKNRLHLDLRVADSLKVFDDQKIDFCFFLACEVGGSKFIATGSNDKAITRNNELMYDNVFPYLKGRSIPFIFSSSQLSVTGTAYGKIKKVAEDIITKMYNSRKSADRLGRYIRIWNVWGAEKIGLKSHILADWIYQCVKHKHVKSHTSGLEQRQFVHTKDMAVGLADLMLNFERLPVRIDVTNGEWVSMRRLAATITEYSNVECTFEFSTRDSSTMIGIEPVNLWRVPSSIHTWMRETFKYYEALVGQETYAQYTDETYLSIIMATSNDDYNGIRARTFNFINSLSRSAEIAHLDYELIVVQYNPTVAPDHFSDNFFLKDPTSDRDLTFSQLFPWTSRHSFGDMRIITVPSELHRWADKGRLWEYVAKNVGAVRAKGKFLLFTNPDDIFPPTLIEQLSKKQLNPTKVYKAGIVLNFQQKGSLEEMTIACNSMAAALYGGAGPNEWGASPELRKSLDSYTNKEYLSGGKADWKFEYVGDFSLFSKDLFLQTGGYLEIPQNTHIEWGHYLWINGEPRFLNGTKPVHSMDDVVCHQDHTRAGRPDAPHEPSAIGEMLKERAKSGAPNNFGLQGMVLPEAWMGDFFDAAFNPETPFLLHHHHHLFRLFEGKIWMGPLDRLFVTDFLGIRTSYHFDCGDSGRYRFFHLSRRWPCSRHDEYLRRNYTGSGLPIMGDLPIVDEEYLEWLSLLRAVKRALAQPWHQPFVVMELGARYGTWTVRAGATMRRLQPHRPVKLLAVEADMSGFEWLKSHLQVNNLSSVTRVVKGFVLDRKNVSVDFQPWERTSTADQVLSYTIEDLLSEYEHVDIIHCDIQGWESVFYTSMGPVNAKVRAIHFGTHRAQTSHADLTKFFVEQGWRVVTDIADNNGAMPGRVEQTEQGPVRILWDGILAVENTKLLARRERAKSRPGHDPSEA